MFRDSCKAASPERLSHQLQHCRGQLHPGSESTCSTCSVSTVWWCDSVIAAGPNPRVRCGCVLAACSWATVGSSPRNSYFFFGFMFFWGDKNWNYVGNSRLWWVSGHHPLPPRQQANCGTQPWALPAEMVVRNPVTSTNPKLPPPQIKARL